jgi:hypothetical protein
LWEVVGVIGIWIEWFHLFSISSFKLTMSPVISIARLFDYQIPFYAENRKSS